MKTRLTSLIILLFLLIIAFTINQKFRSSANKTYILLNSHSVEENIRQWKFTHNQVYAIGIRNFYHFLPGTAQFQQIPKNFIRAVFSPAGQFYATIYLKNLPESGSRDKLLNVDIFTADQKKLYSIQRRQYYDEPYPAIAISDKNGSLVLGRGTTTEIWFYDQTGQLVKQFQLLPDAHHDLERFLSLQFDETGNFLYLVTTTHGITPETAPSPLPPLKSLFMKFSADGRKQWEKSLTGYYTNFAQVSNDGNYLAIGCYTLETQSELIKKALVYNRNGDQILDTDFLPKYATWNHASQQVVLANNHQARAYNLKNGELIWSFKLSNQAKMIAAISGATQTNRTALLIARSQYSANGFYFSEPEIKVLDGKGKLFQNISLPKATFNQPALYLSADGTEIFIGLKDKYQVYKLQ